MGTMLVANAHLGHSMFCVNSSAGSFGIIVLQVSEPC